MGYQTNYYLDVHRGEVKIEEILESIGEHFRGLYYAVDVDGDTLDSVKWYDHEDDMKRLSEQFPDVVFELHGEGEEAGDVWYKYFKSGKMQSCYAQITYEKYDEDKLK